MPPAGEGEDEDGTFVPEDDGACTDDGEWVDDGEWIDDGAWVGGAACCWPPVADGVWVSPPGCVPGASEGSGSADGAPSGDTPSESAGMAAPCWRLVPPMNIWR